MSDRITLSVSDAIRVSGLSRTTLWRAIERGKLKCCRVGRRVLFLPEHLTDFLKAHEVTRPEKRRRRL